MPHFKDQLNRSIHLTTTPTRIISLVPSLTELVVDLGLEAQLVGITKFCIHPAELAHSKTIVGGTKQVHLDKIRDLNPELILTNKEENTAEMIVELEKIAPVYVSDIISIEDMMTCIRDLGTICDRHSQALELVQNIDNELRDFALFIKSKPHRRVAYFIWHHPWMVVGQDNFINTVLKLNKFENVILNPRYPELTLEELWKTNPELVLLSSEPYPFKDSHRSYFTQMESKNIRLVDGEYFSWYGSRFLKALQYFRTLHG